MEEIKELEILIDYMINNWDNIQQLYLDNIYEQLNNIYNKITQQTRFKSLKPNYKIKLSTINLLGIFAYIFCTRYNDVNNRFSKILINIRVILNNYIFHE